MCGSAGALLVLAAVIGASGPAVAADRALGEYLSTECVTCHRANAPPAQAIPRITGWPENQFIAVMNAYKDKQRENPVMQTIAARLAVEEIAALAAYFREQK
jgi:cytochrome c553